MEIKEEIDEIKEEIDEIKEEIDEIKEEIAEIENKEEIKEYEKIKEIEKIKKIEKIEKMEEEQNKKLIEEIKAEPKKEFSGKLKYNTPWILQRADPYVYRHSDGWYYFTASVPAYDGIVLRRARSLEELPDAQETEIWHKHPSGNMSEHIWAPELHYLDQKWYLYFAAGDKEDVWAIRPYVLECCDENPITGAWTEKGMMQCADEDEFSFRGFSLDATVFENRGRYFYVWAEKVGVGKQISNLYIAELESPYRLKTVQVLLTTPDYPWERVGFWVNEGPAVINRDGRVFLTYSASETGAAYCMGMLSADSDSDLLDPLSWKKERMPVLTSEETLGIYGPGHNSFTTDSEGNDIMVYHGRTEKEITGDPLYNPNRHAMLMKVKWNEAGYPVFRIE